MAAGDGNFALACAREGAARGGERPRPGDGGARGARARARRATTSSGCGPTRRSCRSRTTRFDCVGSVFGAVFAPRPEVMARELFRVVRPGSTVGPDGLDARAASPSSCSASAGATRRRPPSCRSAELWGDEETVRERLDGLAARMEIERRSRSSGRPSPRGVRRLAGARRADAGGGARVPLAPSSSRRCHADYLEIVRRRNGGDGPVRIEGDVPPDRGAQARLALTARLLLEYDGSEFAGLGAPARPAHRAGGARGRARDRARATAGADGGGAHRQRRARARAGGEPRGRGRGRLRA